MYRLKITVALLSLSGWLWIVPSIGWARLPENRDFEQAENNNGFDRYLWQDSQKALTGTSQKACSTVAASDIHLDLTCESHAENPRSRLADPNGSLASMLRWISCGTLMAEHPPACWRDRVPRLSQALEEVWAPFCGYRLLNRFLSERTTIEDGLESLVNDVRNSDAVCDSHRDDGGAPRQAAGATQQFPIISEDRRREINDHFEAIRSQVTEACCQPEDGDGCARYFQRLSMRYCNVEPAPGESRTTCASNNGAYFEFATFSPASGMPAQIPWPGPMGWDQSPFRFLYPAWSDDWETTVQRFRQQMPAEPVAMFRLDGRKLGNWNDTYLRYAMRHELGHSCSYYRRYHTMRSDPNTRRAIMAAHTFYPEHASLSYCDSSQFSRDYLLSYAELFQHTGASRETFDCLVDVIQRYPRGRFSNSTACRAICPRIQIEEAFAGWMEFRPLFNNTDQLAERLRNICGTDRSTIHPAAIDNMRCFSRTGIFREAMRTASGCSNY